MKTKHKYRLRIAGVDCLGSVQYDVERHWRFGFWNRLNTTPLSLKEAKLAISELEQLEALCP